MIEYDDVVDGDFNSMKAALIELLKEPSANGEAIIDLLIMTKYYERIGDHAVNIAKWVLFSLTGRSPHFRTIKDWVKFNDFLR